jgi:hypothetical protein
MDLSSDAVRRALRDIDGEHRLELRPTADTIDRLYDVEAPTQEKWDVIVGGANRATWVKVGGVAVLTSAVLAACGDQSPAAAPATTAPPPEGATTTLAGGSRVDASDLTIMRFAASLENLAVAAYEQAARLVTTPTLLALAQLFQSHHKDHAELFNGQLTANGQKAFTEPNSVLLATFKPRIDALKTEADVLRFAQELEVAAASTYFSNVGVLKGEKLGYAAMTIGGSEYRHAALLAMVNGTPIASTKAGFLTATEALAPVGV